MYMRKVIKFIATSLFCAVVVVSGSSNAAQAATFSDVPNTYAYYEDIEYLSQQHVVSGSTGQFRPNMAITSSEWAVMLCRTFAPNELAAIKNANMKTCYDIARNHGWFPNEIAYNQKMTSGNCAYSLLKAIGIDARYQMNCAANYQNKWYTATNLVEDIGISEYHSDYK